ncbi:MAG: L,D-transpeptidase family protein [Epsilonproteobacteria bacterium]|nr:L,D-transpeptidase family protein [Campylobacterota bacterium]
MKLLWFFTITLSLYANSLLDHYRTHGIEGIEKELDYALTNKEYWVQYLQNKDTTFGYVEGYSYILTCDKNSSTLTLYKMNNEGFEPDKEFNAFTGKYKGDKVKEGDLRTPTGIYTFTKKIDKLDSFYGPLAYVTSYPNVYDKYNGKNGSGIWLHGLPIEQEREEYTKGCIAIENPSLLALDKKINYEKTLLIIKNSKENNTISKETIGSILAQLYAWRYSWAYNDIKSYLSFYSDDFKHSNGMEINRFKSYKERIFKKNESKTILFKNLSVIPYPNKEKTFQITFNEIYTSPSYKFEGNKTLLVRLKNSKIEIFAEQ